MRAPFVSLILASLLGLWLWSPCAAVPPQTPLPLTIDLEYARTDASPLLIVVLTPHEGYYAYTHHGDILQPTRVGLIAADRPLDTLVRYPLGVALKDALSGKDVPAYTEPTPIFLTLPAVPYALSLRVSLLLCSAAHCIPVDETISLPPLPGTALPSIENTPWSKAWKDSVPGSPFMAQPLPSLTALEPAASIPLINLPGTAASTPNWDFNPLQADTTFEPTSLGAALFWGLLAGLILNAMPCVLPVLTLKMLALLSPVGVDDNDPNRLRHFREHNLMFAAGVLTWFTLLAGAVSLLDLTWGGLFQHAGVVTALTGLIGLLGLSMLDLCTLPILDLKLGSTTMGNPRGQAYLAGITATLLATPCSGPLLGGVLAWSASQPPLIVLLVFLGTGCGMALPYLLFAARPSAVTLLPRPGPWLIWLERGVGLFLLATTFWLLLILPRITALALSAGLILLAIILTLRRARRAGRPFLPLAVVLLCGLPGLWLLNEATEPPSSNQSVWESFTPESFTQALGQERMLLEFTADWCPNCKALELTTLSPERLRDWQKRYALRLIRVDMTKHDLERESLLRALGSISIPLTAVFPVGENWRRPLVLRDLYTPAGLEKTLDALDKMRDSP